MINTNLKFIPRDTRDHSKESVAERRYHRIKGKSLKNILIDRFLNHYGYDKGKVTANAIVDDILLLIESFYQYKDRWYGTLYPLINTLKKANPSPNPLLNLLSWILYLNLT
jgi:hypothetical protein